MAADARLKWKPVLTFCCGCHKHCFMVCTLSIMKMSVKLGLKNTMEQARNLSTCLASEQRVNVALCLRTKLDLHLRAKNVKTAGLNVPMIMTAC